jgi:hypothetical protein
MNPKRNPSKKNPYRTRVGRVSYRFMLTQDNLDLVKKKAIQKDISYSAVIETCIENYLNQIA